MLLHIVPKLVTPWRDVAYQLVDITINELGLCLVWGRDVCTWRPYPNRSFLVGSRITAERPHEGFLVQTEEPIWSFTVVTRWAVQAEDLVTHRVVYEVLDRDYPLVSDDVGLWREQRDFTDRCPSDCAGIDPASISPHMSLLPTFRKGNYKDTFNSHGIIVRREERLQVPTIESRRLGLERPLPILRPTRGEAFRVGGGQRESLAAPSLCPVIGGGLDGN